MQQYTGSRTHPITAPSLQTALFVVALGRKIFTTTESAGSHSLWLLWNLVFIGFTKCSQNVHKCSQNVHKCSQNLVGLIMIVTVPGIHWVHKYCPLCNAPRRFHHCSLDDHRRHVIWMIIIILMIMVILIILMIMVIGDFPKLSTHPPYRKNSQKLVFFLSLMIMIRITCQYTGHCCMLPLSLHKRRVAGRWQQHLGRVCTSGSCFWNFGAPLCTLKVEKNLGQCTMEKTLKVQQNSLQRGFSPGEIMAELRSRKIQGDFFNCPPPKNHKFKKN